MAYIGREPQVGNFQVCDPISVVNGQAAYTMQVNSVNVSPETAFHVLCSLNGVLQKPGSSFTISGSTITFASNLVTGDVIDFIQILGSTLDLGVPSDNTVSLAKLTATGTKSSSTFLRGDNTFAEAGGGKILQVVSSGVIDQTYSSNATSYTAVTSHSLAITPSSTSSKVFMMFSFNARSTGTANTTYTLYRGSTNLNTNGFTILHDDNGSADTEVQCTLTFLDSPSTTSATTYALYGKSADSGDSFRVNTKGSDSVITLFEVGA